MALRPDTEIRLALPDYARQDLDFTATQSIILAELEIDRTLRKVLMQAPKNGFFYVIDRTNGKLISAEPFVPVNWAKDKTWRPVGRSRTKLVTLMALRWLCQRLSVAITGTHVLQPRDRPRLFIISGLPTCMESTAGTRDNPDGLNIKVSLLANEPPDTEAERRALIKQAVKGSLLAWDPVAQQEALEGGVRHHLEWRHPGCCGRAGLPGSFRPELRSL